MDFMSASHRQNKNAGSVTVCVFVVGIVQLEDGVVVNIRYNTVNGSVLGEFSLSLCQSLLPLTVAQKYNSVSRSLFANCTACFDTSSKLYICRDMED